MIDDKVMKYLVVVSVFIDFYKEGYLTDEEYKAVEDKIVKKSGIHPRSIYRLKLNNVKEKLLKR